MQKNDYFFPVTVIHWVKNRIHAILDFNNTNMDSSFSLKGKVLDSHWISIKDWGQRVDVISLCNAPGAAD
ncbi:MAG: hypothetical protein DBO99_05570 [gamma proteobacterium symbiont of Ctena orbiculata]|nr:MAG: hypothetical protein DBO99_05570 [gamma proteobacterium symbiont of Ctena orbiculata]